MQNSPTVLISGSSTEISGLKAGIERLIPGIVIVTADSGKDTLKTAQSASYDLFISFFSLSDMKGTELLEKLSAVETKPAFLLIYKNEDKGDVLDALECGGQFSIQQYAEQGILAKKTADKIRRIIRRNKEEILQCIPKPREVSYFRESPDGIFITNGEGHFVDVNPSACTMTGYSREELLKMSIPDIHEPSAVKEGLEALGEVKNTGHSYGEFLFRKKSGEHFYMSVDSVRTGPDEYVGFCRDITDRILAARELKESEERYRGLFEGVPDYIIVHRKGKILFANPPVVNTFGRMGESLIGSHILEYVAEESKEEAIYAMKKRTAGGIVPKYEIVVNTNLGPRITEVSGTLIKYEGEDAIIIVLTDITEKKEALRDLQKSREQYKSLVENINEIVFSIDNDGLITYISPSIEPLIGKKTDEIVGRHYQDFIHQGDRINVDKHFKMQLEGITKPVTFRIKDKNGTTRYMRTSSHTIEDNSTIKGFSGTISDYTGEYLARKELVESEKRFRELFENSPVAYQSLDRDGRFIDINSEWTNLTGFTRDETTGKSFSKFWPDENTGEYSRTLSGFLAGTEVNAELRLKTKNDEIKTVLLSGRVQRNAKGDFVRTHCILFDITIRKQSEEYTRLLANMADNAPASIIVHNFKGDILYANEETFRLHGYSRDEFMDMNLYALNTPEYREMLDKRLKELKTKGELHYDTGHFRKNGSTIPLHVNMKLAEWEGRQVLLNIATDLTERKKSESILKERNIFLQRLIDTIPNPVFYKDREGRYIGCNTAFEEYIGIQRKNLLGKTVYEISLKKLADVYREHDRMLFEKPGVQKYESRMKHADGKLRDVIFYKATYNDIKGDVAGLVGVILDISERKEMEDALKRSEEKFKSYVNFAMEGIMVADPSGRYIDVNPAACRLLGYTEDELLALGIPDVVQPDELEGVITEFESIKNKGHVSREITMLAKDKKPVSIMLSAVRMPDDNTLGIHTDITDLKNAEDGLREANRKLNLLSSITRHDILNQLTGIIAFLEMIEMDREFAPGSNAEKYLKKISGAAQTIKRQILFTKDYKDMGEQAPKWQNVRDIVEDISQNPAFDNISAEISLDELKIYADPLFGKVIYNLFDNTVKHGEKAKKIRFSVEKDDSDAVIICEDDGLGVPEEFKEKIFRREHYKNTGLGLFLSGEILSITGITIKETGVYGKGARFEITVPKGKYNLKNM